MNEIRLSKGLYVNFTIWGGEDLGNDHNFLYRFLFSLLSAQIYLPFLGIIKDNEVNTETSRPSNMMIYYALGVISVLAVGVILYSIHRSRNPKEE